MTVLNRKLGLSILYIVWTLACSCQPITDHNLKHVGGPCEGCEAIYEYGTKKLIPTDTLPHFLSEQPKLKLTGTIFKKDAKTPAEGVILYIYHTNRAGIYEKIPEATGWARRHGLMRGWIKTSSDGKYTFYTFRPAPYPDGTEAEHIHMTVKEPGLNEYYIDDIVFNDDPLLDKEKRNNLPNRGGSGIVKPLKEQNLITIKRNIILGHNILDYPQ